MIQAPNLAFPWLRHGFGLRNSIPPDELTTVKQIHSALVLDACGSKGRQLGEGDAIFSSQPAVAIGIRTADCVPILIADAKTRAIACVHAGWRGTAANILTNTIREFQARGSSAENLHVAIGPSIGSCCYEVGTDVAHQFEPWGHAIGNKLDLPGMNERQARAAGVRDVWVSGECTYCEAERFFSFRREQERAGRMLSFVVSAS